MKTLRWLLLLLALAGVAPQRALSIGGMDEDYCNVPGWLMTGGGGTPNIMLAFNMAESMLTQAYLTSSAPNVYTAGQKYYGLFESAKCYEYMEPVVGDGYYVAVGDANADFSCVTVQASGNPNAWAGTILNMATSTRQESIKVALAGPYMNTMSGQLYAYGDPLSCFDASYDIQIANPGYLPAGGTGTLTTTRLSWEGDKCPSNGVAQVTNWNNLNAFRPHVVLEYTAGGTCTTSRVTTTIPQGDCVAPTYPNPVESACSIPPNERTYVGGCGAGNRCTAGYATCTPASGFVCSATQNNKHVDCTIATNSCSAVINGACPGDDSKNTVGSAATICIGSPTLSINGCKTGTADPSGGAICTYPSACTCEYDATSCTGGGAVTKTFNLRYQTPSAVMGVMDELGNKARWGVTGFVNGNGPWYEPWGGTSTGNGGRTMAPLGAPLSDVERALYRLSGDQHGPVVTGLFSSIKYYSLDGNYLASSDQSNLWNGSTPSAGSTRDPIYGYPGLTCNSLNVIFLTDGNPGGAESGSMVGAVGDWDADSLEGNINSATLPGGWPPAVMGPSWTAFTASGEDELKLDDLVYRYHTIDARPDLEGFQPINTYHILAFPNDDNVGQIARYIGWNSGKNGVFKDLNGNNKPDLQNEWDQDGDDIPDGFFLVEDGEELANQMKKALSKILEQTSSASSIDFVGASGGGGGLIVQPFFNPKKKTSLGAELYEATWVGFVRSFFVDAAGNFREDTNNDFQMTGDDNVVRFRYDSQQQATIADLYVWPSLTEILEDTATAADSILSEDLSAMFDLGQLLATRVSVSGQMERKIFTSRPGNNWVEFTSAAASQLQPYMGPNITNAGDAASVIEYVRGVDQPGMRSRQMVLTGSPQTWVLGDVINSESLVKGPPPIDCWFWGCPLEIEDTIETLSTDLKTHYMAFAEAHKNDHTFLYAGANDGMMHAFALGRLLTDGTTKQLSVESSSPGKIMTPSTPNVVGSGVEIDIGHEAWAYIPYSVLPHLNWLTEPEYCHVYTVDGPPKTIEAQVFSPDSVHVNGWGRILMFGLRLGCPTIVSSGTTIRPVYVFLDVTDPYNPGYLYHFSDADMGFTYLSPSTLRDMQADGSFQYRFVFVSGPTDGVDYTRSGTSYLYSLKAPVKGAGGWTLSKRPLLSGTLDGFIPTSIVAGDMMERDFLQHEDYMDIWKNIPNTLGVGQHKSGRDLVDDMIYIGGYVPNGTELDGYVIAVDIKNRRGSDPAESPIADPVNSNNQNDNISEWRIRVLSYFEKQPVQSVAFNDATPMMYVSTGRYETQSDQATDEQQSIYLLIDPCYNGESGSTPAVVCPPMGNGDISTPLLDKDPYDLSTYTSSLYTCSEETGISCSGGGCATADEIRAEIGERFRAKFDFPHDSERAYGKLTPLPSAYGRSVIATGYAPSSEAVCTPAGSGYIYTLTLWPHQDGCVGISLPTVSTLGAPQVTPPSSTGTIYYADQYGNVGSAGSLPELAGPFFGFGPTLIKD